MIRFLLVLALTLVSHNAEAFLLAGQVQPRGIVEVAQAGFEGNEVIENTAVDTCLIKFTVDSPSPYYVELTADPDNKFRIENASTDPCLVLDNTLSGPDIHAYSVRACNTRDQCGGIEGDVVVNTSISVIDIPPPDPEATFTVSNSSQLLNALQTAVGGDTIAVEPGNYGGLSITQTYSSEVIVFADDPENRPVFTSITLTNCSNLTFDGMRDEGAAGYQLRIAGGSNITYKNGTIISTNVGGKATYASGVTNLTYENNIIGGGEDAFHLVAMTTLNVINNTHTGNFTFNPGDHLDFLQIRLGASNVHIRGNVFIVGNAPNVQGIFFDDGPYVNMLVEQNIIYTGMLNGIKYGGGGSESGNTYRNNTVVNAPGLVHTQTSIIASGTITGNIATAPSGSAGIVSGNLILHHNGSTSDQYSYNTNLVDARQGLGQALSGLAPIASSHADSYGALVRLGELLP